MTRTLNFAPHFATTLPENHALMVKCKLTYRYKPLIGK
jgi:hypothetical protein